MFGGLDVFWLVLIGEMCLIVWIVFIFGFASVVGFGGLYLLFGFHSSDGFGCFDYFLTWCW